MVVSASTTPQDVAGVLEVQVAVPASLSPGQVEVSLSVGANSTYDVFSSGVEFVYIFVK
jgi:hypothetical protein